MPDARQVLRYRTSREVEVYGQVSGNRAEEVQLVRPGYTYVGRPSK